MAAGEPPLTELEGSPQKKGALARESAADREILRMSRLEHAVADPAHGRDVGWPARFIAELAAEPVSNALAIISSLL